jgi:hypothetical protein
MLKSISTTCVRWGLRWYACRRAHQRDRLRTLTYLVLGSQEHIAHVEVAMNRTSPQEVAQAVRDLVQPPEGL